MRNRFVLNLAFCITVAFYAITFINTSSGQEAKSSFGFEYKGFWPDSNIDFIIGKKPPNINGADLSAGRPLVIGRLAQVASLWNHASNFNYSLSVDCNHGDAFVEDCIYQSGSPERDGKNAIMFGAIPRNGFGGAISIARTQYVLGSGFPCYIPRPGSRLCLDEKIEEVDVFIQPRVTGWATTADSSSCSTEVKTYYVENILAHEMGHAIGAPHSRGRGDMMFQETATCSDDNRSITLTTADKKLVRDIYGPFDQVEVAILQPMQNQTIFPGAPVSLNAEFSTRSAESGSGIAGVEIVWETSGREIASGASTSVDTDEFVPGHQELTAVARSSSGARLGANSVSVELITDLIVDDEFIVFPVPCINLAGSSDGRCMLRLKENWFSYQCGSGFFDHDISAKDLFTNRNFSVIEPSYDQSPWGTGCEDNTSYDLFYGIWAVSASDRFFLRFDHDVFRSGVWRNRYTVSGLIHKTGPVLEEFSIPDSCQIAPDEAHCAVDISWGGHYFAPSSALYFRRDSTDDWTKVADMGLNAGSFQTDKIVPFSGGQFAVFQYGSDFRVPSSSNFSPLFGPYRTLISAPAGLLAGPFSVDATLVEESPVSPRSGLWGNSVTDGTGVSLTRSSNGTRLLIWLTYENNGKAVWYMSQPAIETDGVFSAPLEKITWKASTASLSRNVVGNVAYAALTNDRVIFDWELDDGSNESTGAEILTHTIGGDIPTGLWNEPGAANGRGFVMHSETLNGVKRNFLTSLTYSGDGKPRWQSGGVDGALMWHTRIDMNENRRTVVCGNCQPIEYRLDAHPVGQLTAEFNGTATGWVNIQNLDNGEWVRGNSLNPVIFGQLTTRQLFFDE